MSRLGIEGHKYSMANAILNFTADCLIFGNRDEWVFFYLFLEGISFCCGFANVLTITKSSVDILVSCMGQSSISPQDSSLSGRKWCYETLRSARVESFLLTLLLPISAIFPPKTTINK